MNVGLSAGAGAAGSLVGGGVGFGLENLTSSGAVGFFGGAVAAGAVSSTIMGGDPGEGALYAIAAAGLSLGVQYANYQYQKHLAAKTLPTAVSLTIDVVGKIWNLPNTVLGLAYGGAGHVAGWFMGTDPQIQFGHNGIEFLNNPFIISDRALTLGNVMMYGVDVGPMSPEAYGDPLVPYGLHEEAHTYQSQVLGPAFIPAYMLNGGPSIHNPFEKAAQNYGGRTGHWWPWRW